MNEQHVSECLFEMTGFSHHKTYSMVQISWSITCKEMLWSTNVKKKKKLKELNKI